VIDLEIVGTGHPIVEADLVEFRLLFAGALPSAASAPQKHVIRRSFHPQLRELWRQHVNLRNLAAAKGNDGQPTSGEEERFSKGIAAIGKNWRRGNYNLVPLVTSEMVLRCSLDIIILRPENEYGIVRNGDIDNKLKTLFDALRMPVSAAETGQASPEEDEEPLFVLLEDDGLISEVKVSTDRLLMLPNERRIRSEDAYAMIHVRVNHRNARTFDNYFG
jgi:hypothetical protein